MINKITRESVGKELFENIIDDWEDFSRQDHRKQSNFYVQAIFIINEEFLPDRPDLWGFWESNSFIWDSEYGMDRSDIDELTRVEKKTKTVVTEEWVPV